MNGQVSARGPGAPVRTSVVGLGWAAKSIWLPDCAGIPRSP
ncbi:hypothetical protein ACFQ60_36295 [Streptomyces zhihengii]